MGYLYIFNVPTMDNIESVNFREKDGTLSIPHDKLLIGASKTQFAIGSDYLLDKEVYSTLHFTFGKIPFTIVDEENFMAWLRGEAELEFIHPETGEVLKADGKNEDV